MKTPLVILVDIGNTSTHVSLERAGCFLFAKRLPSHGQTIQKVQRFLRSYASRSKIDGAILCSVVPNLDKIWLNELKRRVSGKVLRLNHELNLGIKINYPNPGAIGADRLANAVAAAERYGTPVIVADFGTALTVDVVSAKREYIGGIIAPGPMLFADYMAERTALLPRLSLGTVKRRGKTAIGKSTREAMLIGWGVGYQGMFKEIIRRLKQEPGLQNARICATGGYAGLILTGNDSEISFDPFLTLRGISRIYWLNGQR